MEPIKTRTISDGSAIPACVITGTVMGLLVLALPCADAQEQRTQPEDAVETAQQQAPEAGSEISPQPQPETGPEAETLPGTTAPAEAGAAPALEEIVVTARKVVEPIQEAPLSVVVLSAEKLTTASITKVQELVPYVPNFAMSETGIGTNLYVRGIGSGINQGFEQSVGLYVDGIYYGRAQLTRAPFLDIAQAEALRGPQAILLGNNSIAGALNLTTAKPTNTFYASADALYEPDANEQEFNGVISGPLTDRLSARLAGRYKTIDGYVENVTLGRNEPNREEKSGRLTLAWAADTWTADLKLEKNTFDVKGRQIEIIKALPSTQQAVDEGLTSSTGFSQNSGSATALWWPDHTYLEYLSTFFGATSPVAGEFDPENDYLPPNPLFGNGVLDFTRGAGCLPTSDSPCDQSTYNAGDTSNNHIDVGVLTFNADIGRYNVASTTGYLKYDYSENCDCDFTGAPQFSLLSQENFRQWSQEFRITSPTTDRIHWLAGAYYQNDSLDFGDQIFLPIGSGVVRLVGYATTGNDQGANDSLGNTSAFRDFHQHDYVSSVFGQIGVDITDRWRTSLGVRYTHMEKDASRILREGDLNRVPYDLNDPEGYNRLYSGAVLFGSIFKAAFHQLSGNRTENHTAYELVTEFNFNDDAMVYGSWKTGFKSGGFDARSNSEPVPGSTGVGSLFPASVQDVVQDVPPGSFEFQDERANAFEVGSKLTMLNGTAEINIALFYTKFDNLQVSIFDGTLGFNVGNAPAATTQGMELDARWSISEQWYVTGSLALLDFTFDNFKNGQCDQGQVPTYPADLPPDDPNYPYRGKCDYTGKTNQYVAPYSGALGINYEHPVGSRYLFRSGLDVLFTDRYNPSQNLDRRVEQDGYAMFNLRVALADADDRWEVALLGRNLTDQKVVTYANDTPLAYSQFGSPTWYGFVDRPRNVALQASYRFAD